MRAPVSVVRGILAVLLLCGLCQTAMSQASATATVSPNPLMAGQTAEYTISFVNTSSLPSLLKPRVEGLQFSDNVSNSNYQTIVNGAFSSEKRLTWTFVATREGSFSIPGRTVDVQGTMVQIPAVQVEVVPPEEEARSRALLRLEAPEGPYFVGQALEARLILLVRADLNITNISFPQRLGDAFINSEFNPEPERARTRFNGRLYNAFVWNIVITPIKSGPASLAFSQSIAIQVPNNDRLQGFFSLNVGRPESLLIESEAVSTEVLSLPLDEQPHSFNGAIGDFLLEGELSSLSVKVGQPLTLTLRLSGKGNFDRISAPALPESPDWRLYPPNASFTPGTSTIEGTKAFEYILIPQSTQPTTLPEIAFSYFDPVRQAYQQLPLEPLAIEILPADPTDNAIAPFLDPRTAPVEGPSIPEALLPIRPSLGSLRPLQSLWQRPGFVGIHLGIGLTLLLGGLVARRRKALREDHTFARRHAGGRRLRKALSQADDAAKANQPEAFFRAARTALQECAAMAGTDRVEAHSLVPSDCLERLSNKGLSETTLQAAKEILEAADAHHFAGQIPSHGQLGQLRKGLLSILSSLNKSSK
ncbi:MAG: hypothetical protein RL648_1807 [Verrucomicrobiota bacterium]